ncbi:mCpol domain-containing protein [Anabaena azotica]|uniref:MCpol domain-containing protein n=1 Tax=Anabaena azotica FACHB-119 TaxID=947527 RepID=A0ABR8D4B0_9NOST|nr:mCpol domain-containing protein [Anabaena azotica]MBD2501268.1 mCpol domain-containing protein [Anabaena azotica FACHB-119]
MLYNKSLVCLGDGDNIGDAIELYLLSGNLDAAKNFSYQVENAITKIAELVEAQMEASLVYVAGDDICFEVSPEKNIRQNLNNYSNLFLQITGKTISFGVGTNSLEALVCLRKAKVSGKGCVVIFGGID